jgi:ATP/maltotriose-dependent transcriptional regulator MalT
MYYGNCLLDRCQLLQLQGAWPEAMDVAERACEVLADHHPETAGSARYQMAEIQRLRGNLAEAEESYRRASQAGRDPEPGMSLLRLAQGRPDSAAGAIKRALDEAEGPMDRCRVLPSFVEIMLATGDLESARAGADELAAIAAEQQAPFFWALAAHRCGAVMLAQEDYRGALNQLRDASKRWQEIGAPYEAACVRILIAQAMQALGDDEGAALELDGARWALRQLGAERDVPGLRDASEISAVAGLTARECEVLALLAAGKTNKQISSDLTISEHTVARHLQNIFAKLGVSSRTGAIAFAFENNLVSRPDS